MQLTKSYWRVVAVAGVVGAFVASACVVTTSTDDNAGGAEATTGGSSSGAVTSTGGSSGVATGGSATSGGTAGFSGSTSTGGANAGAAAYQCDPDDGGMLPSTAASCAPSDTTDPCAVCLQKSCCTEVSACYATNPGNECGHGGPNLMGEFVCVQGCLQNGFMDSGVDDSDLRQKCYDECLTPGCQGPIGTQTNSLIACLSDNCLNECIGG